MSDQQEINEEVPVFTNDTLFDDHEWVQKGYELVHSCKTPCMAAPQGVSIPAGKMLTKKGGKYTLVDEIAVVV